MPQQQYDRNTERVALRRRVPEEDQWIVPHELYLAMFSRRPTAEENVYAEQLLNAAGDNRRAVIEDLM